MLEALHSQSPNRSSLLGLVLLSEIFVRCVS